MQNLLATRPLTGPGAGAQPGTQTPKFASYIPNTLRQRQGIRYIGGRMNVIRTLDPIPASQNGYFTRTQANNAGIADYQLTRVIAQGWVDRVGHGVYRVAGAGHDELGLLRVEWLRLTTGTSPAERLQSPRTWVSHHSAASVHQCGVFLADDHSFISAHRVRTAPNVRVRLRTHGLKVDEWTEIDGFAVTTIERTAQDLLNEHADGGHIGYMMWDAINKGKTTLERLNTAIGFDPNVLIDQALSKFR
jgi:predicted transcriptional regulator of viral defense system